MEYWAPLWYNSDFMFTGIIEQLGKVEGLVRFKDRMTLSVACSFAPLLKEGDSVSVNGVCLTVAEKTRKYFTSDVVSETLDKSSLKYLKVSDFVNLERAMPADARFDGHIVQGHIDCRSVVTNIIIMGPARELEIKIDDRFRKYLAQKGSVAVDGVSLTVAGLDDRYFRVAIVPHTALKTNLFHKKIGDHVNLEFDVLAKYVENMIKSKQDLDLASVSNMRIDENFLKKAGFLN